VRPRFVTRLVGCAALMSALATARAHAEGDTTARVRTSLVWIWGDDDVLHAPGDSTPPSPGAGIGDRPGYDGLFEGLASRYTGRENRSEVRLEGEAPGLLPRLTTRAGLALGFELGALGDRSTPLLVADLGSFVEARWSLGGRGPRENTLTLRLLPLNGDRERVGELEALAWGGAVGPRWESPYAAATGPVRAARLEVALGPVRTYVGLKTATFLEGRPSGPAVPETSYGVHAGVESRWSAPVAVALGFGHFEHGRLADTAGSARATTTGVSLRVSFGVGLERPRPPVAFLSDGSPFERMQPTPALHAFALGLEAAHLVQRLESGDHPGESVLAPARAAAATAELRDRVLDLRAAFIVRDPSFVMRNAPGVFPGQAVPRDAAEQPELGILASAGLLFTPVVSPSLSAGVSWPGAVMLQAVDRQGQVVGGTLVVHGPGDVEALPPGEVPVPVLDLRPGLELRLSPLLEVVGWLDYRRDFNRTHLVSTPDGTLARGFRSPERLGYGVAARAVW